MTTILFLSCPEELDDQNTKACSELTTPPIPFTFQQRSVCRGAGWKVSQPPPVCSFIKSLAYMSYGFGPWAILKEP